MIPFALGSALVFGAALSYAIYLLQFFLVHPPAMLVLPVPKENLTACRRMAREAGQVFRELGALAYVEAMADDVKPGKWTSFPRSVKLKPGEVVVFSCILDKSRRDRDRISKQFMNDPRMEKYSDPNKMPFDGKRMFWRGFKPIVSLQQPARGPGHSWCRVRAGRCCLPLGNYLTSSRLSRT